MLEGCVPICVSHDTVPLYIGKPSGSELPIESLYYMAPLTCAIHQRRVCPDWPMSGVSGPRLA